jgi:hypothetical protein
MYIQDNHASDQTNTLTVAISQETPRAVQTCTSIYPNNMMMPDNTGFYIDEVAIPVSWYTIEEGRNNELYVRVAGVLRAFTIASGN